MDPVTALSASYTALRFVRDSMSVALGAKIDEGARVKISEALERLTSVQDCLFEAQQRMFQLQAENTQLKSALADAQSWSDRAGAYSLDVSPGGAVVYRYSGVPEHFACPICLEKKTIAILQDRKVISGTWDCPSCKAEYAVSESKTFRR